jgi:Transglycosylase SLT domain
MLRTPACRLPILAVTLLALTTGHPVAVEDPSALCLDASTDAAARSGVPPEVLLAISVVETGREGRPWPWTVNLGGEGHWLATADEAETMVERALNEGRTNIDIGCFQLNLRWHAAGFASIRDMLNPEANAQYAADYLAGHFAKTGDWALAAAAYHSATPEHAERYRLRFETVLASLPDGPQADQIDTGTTYSDRSNRFPLLLAGDAPRNGSIVPAISGGARLIGGP